jgi:hypothetical protein
MFCLGNDESSLHTVSTYILPDDENPYKMDIWSPMLQTLANYRKTPPKIENFNVFCGVCEGSSSREVNGRK